MRASTLFVLGAGAALGAQTYSYSPIAASTAEQSSNNTIPWFSATHHYQQIHGDLRGLPRLLQALSLRRDGTAGSGSAIARTVNLELWLGNGSLATFGTVYADNFTGMRTRVFDAKNVSFPDWTMTQGSPAPWSLVFPFDRPFVYVANTDLIWEAFVFSTTSTAGYFADAYGGSASSGLGAVVALGTGCVASGRTGTVQLVSGSHSNSFTNTVDAAWTMRNAVAASPSAILLGTTDPNLPVPGLCTNLRVGGPGLLVVTGMSDAGGTHAIPPLTAPWDPSYVGAQLYSQAFCVDAASSQPIKVAGSNGSRLTIAGSGTDSPIRRLYANDVNATVGSIETYTYGIVIRLTSP